MMTVTSTEQETDVGRTTESVTVENYTDVALVSMRQLPAEQIRKVELDAIVDTGASHLCLPPSAIDALGLLLLGTRRVKTANGIVDRRVFQGACVTIQGRTEQLSVMENDEATPPLIGSVVLEVLDFVVDPKGQRLVPNPEHGGEWMADLY